MAVRVGVGALREDWDAQAHAAGSTSLRPCWRMKSAICCEACSSFCEACSSSCESCRTFLRSVIFFSISIWLASSASLCVTFSFSICHGDGREQWLVGASRCALGTTISPCSAVSVSTSIPIMNMVRSLTTQGNLQVSSRRRHAPAPAPAHRAASPCSSVELHGFLSRQPCGTYHEPRDPYWAHG